MADNDHGMCGNGEEFGDGTPALKLPTNRPLVLVRDPLPNHPVDEIWQWMEEAFRRWTAVCDIVPRRIFDLAQAGPKDVINLVTVADLGGRGVLADQMLPYQGGNILRMRINSRITWRATDSSMLQGTIDPVRTLCHEIGHFLGHAHWPVGAPPELMEPTISNTIIRPQPTEARVTAGWYGSPTGTPTPGPNPPGPPGSTVSIVHYDAGGREVGRWLVH